MKINYLITFFMAALTGSGAVLGESIYPATPNNSYNINNVDPYTGWLGQLDVNFENQPAGSTFNDQIHITLNSNYRLNVVVANWWGLSNLSATMNGIDSFSAGTGTYNDGTAYQTLSGSTAPALTSYQLTVSGTISGSQYGSDQVAGGYGIIYSGVAPVPEPQSYAMLLTGLALMAFAAGKRARRPVTARRRA